MRATFKAVFIVAMLLLSLVVAPASQAQVLARGVPLVAFGPQNLPIPPGDGFPLWYQDSNGVSLGQCLDVNFCGLLPDAGFNPANPLVFPTNYPGEQFYYLAETFVGPTNTEILYIAAIEGSFAGAGNPANGQQAVFSRIRIRGNVSLLGTYTVTHPYGTDTFVVDAIIPGPEINQSIDIFGLVPLSFNGPTDASSTVGPFLESAAGRITDPATGNVYLANAASLVAVTGAPTGNNFVRVTGPEGTFTSTLFTLSGRVVGNTATPNVLTFPTQKANIDSAAQTVTITNISRTTPITLGAITFEGATVAGDFKIATVPADGCSGATVPASTATVPGTCTFGVIFSSATGTPAARTASAVVTTTTPTGMPPMRVNLRGTIDAVPPTVTNTFPANGQTVPANATITALFSEPMAAVTIAGNPSASFSMLGSGGTVTGNVTFDAANNIATFIPVTILAENQTFTVTISTAATDLAGNGLAQDNVFSFLTIPPDNTRPTILSRNPAPNALGVRLDTPITVTFDEQMHAAAINSTTFLVNNGDIAGTITYDAVTRTATFTPAVTLSAGQAYTVTIKGGPGGVDDLAQNTLAADVSWSFVANHLPTPAALTFPENGASGVPTTVTFKWARSTDDDGDALEYHIEICNNAFFLGCDHQAVPLASAPRLNGAYFAGLGGFGMAVIGLVSFGGIKGRKRLLLLLMALVIVSGTLISACGRDKTNTVTVPQPSAAEVTFTASNLNPGALYFWRVESHDPNGGAGMSEVRNFRTQ